MAAVLQMLETGKEKSPIHNLDPRAKLIWWFCLIILPILITNPYILLLITAWIWLMTPVARIARRMYRLLITMYPLMVGFIMLTWPFFYPGGEHILIHWAFIRVTVEGILYAFAMGLRIVTALTACMFFVMVTDLMDLASALGEFLQERFGVSYTYPLIIISSFKFLPEVSGDFVTVTESFRSRALDLDTGSFTQRLRKIAPVAVPLIDGTLRRAHNIAIALELKAFGAQKRRTFYVQHRFTPRDGLFAASGLLALIICAYIRWIGLGTVDIFL
ncbi:MAG TPA: energy-coupling factor transporter transmembrane protein EcfT [Anaerolineae bacterium]|nr:energy-coupling factor transporter transmembrane protein EcfT [Anaerolineae bacterium]